MCMAGPAGRVPISAALSRAFLAKTIFNIDDTLGLIERLRLDKTLRRLCGWGGAGTVPSEATFSRAFAEFAAARLGPRLLEAVVVAHHGDHLVGHVARDSTAIEARERPARRPRAPAEPKRKRGRPRKGKERKTPPPERRLERQPGQSLAEMTAELPRDCARGVKQNAQGYRIHWTGYKLHIDTADGDIPLSAILTSANTHDSQAAIPLATMTASGARDLALRSDGQRLRRGRDQGPQPKPRPRADHRAAPEGNRPQGRTARRGQAAALDRLVPARRSPLPAARCRRTRRPTSRTTSPAA